MRIERPDAHRVIVHGAGLQGLQRAGAALDMGNAGTAMRLFMGLLAARPFDSTLIGDAVADAPADGARGDAAAARWARASRPTRAGRRCASTAAQPLRAIDYAMPVASAQVKSALLLAAL